MRARTKERKNTDSVPLSSYLLRVGTLLQITEHGREPLIADLTRSYSEVTGTFEVHPLGWPFAVVLHLDGIKDIRMPCPTGEALSYAEYVAIKRRQRGAFEREHGTAPQSPEDEERAKPFLPATPRGGCDE